jgi:hypothetical protein
LRCISGSLSWPSHGALPAPLHLCLPLPS